MTPFQSLEEALTWFHSLPNDFGIELWRWSGDRWNVRIERWEKDVQVLNIHIANRDNLVEALNEAAAKFQQYQSDNVR